MLAGTGKVSVNTSLFVGLSTKNHGAGSMLPLDNTHNVQTQRSCLGDIKVFFGAVM